MDEENLNNMNENFNEQGIPQVDNNEMQNDPMVDNPMQNDPMVDDSMQNEQVEDDASDSNVIKLKDEMGNDVYFEFLDLIEFEGENYVILLPTDDLESEEADEVVILKEDKQAEDVEEGQESYVSVDDEETLNKVFDIFKEKFKDEFNFVDDENN